MATPERVFAHIKADQVAEGYYTLQGDILTMTYSNGEPVMILDRPVTHTLRPEDNPKSIAAVLTKDIRKKLRNELVDGFDAPVVFTAQGWR